jgi:transcriptional antiterminator RfaH
MQDHECRWLAVYTRAQCERSLAQYLRERGLTSFVPLQRRRHRWSDRFKWVEEPLIPSYVFVFLSAFQHGHLYEAPGAVGLVTFRGRPAVVRQDEIDFLRRTERHAETSAIGRTKAERGRAVRITGGLFAGYSGTVVCAGEYYAIAVSIDEIAYSVQVKVPCADVSLV